jgi:hypothetical protein
VGGFLFSFNCGAVVVWVLLACFDFLFYCFMIGFVRVEWFLGVDDDGLSRVPFPGLRACSMDGAGTVGMSVIVADMEKERSSVNGKVTIYPEKNWCRVDRVVDGDYRRIRRGSASKRDGEIGHLGRL